MALVCVSQCSVELRPGGCADPRLLLAASRLPPPSECGCQGRRTHHRTGDESPPSDLVGAGGKAWKQPQFRAQASLQPDPQMLRRLQGQMASHHLPGRASHRCPVSEGGRAHGAGGVSLLPRQHLVSGFMVPTELLIVGRQDCVCSFQLQCWAPGTGGGTGGWMLLPDSLGPPALRWPHGPPQCRLGSSG